MNCPPVCNLPIFDSIPGAKWPHQKDHRPGHPKFCARNCWHQRFYHLYHLPRRYSEIKYWISEIHAIQILRKLWGLSFPTLSWSSRTWRSISHLRFRWEVVESKQFICTMDIEIICLTNVNQNPSNRFWTTKMCEGGSERQTINLPPGEHLWLGSNELLFQGQAFHLHNADEAWWWLEPDPGAGIKKTYFLIVS